MTIKPLEIHHSPAEATAILLDLQAEEDEDGWTYTIIASGQYAQIEIKDEDGEFIGYL